MDRRTRLSLLVAVCAVTVLAVLVGLEDVVTGVVVGVVGLAALLLIGWWSGRRGRHMAWDEAKDLLATDHAVVMWKPGCVYCERLLLTLGRDPRISWVNVWRDAQANARVRELNDGDELTPTVLLGEQVLRNPSAADLRSRLQSSGKPQYG